jgi:cell division protein FtsI/penicillin-binding protein 2
MMLTRLLGVVAFLMVARVGIPDASSELRPSCEKALGGRSGAIIVISLPEGRVLYEHDQEMSQKRFRGCSVVKPLTAYALLKDRLITAEETVTSSRRIVVERYGLTLESGYEEPGRILNLRHALALSANSYFYLMGARMEPSRLIEYYQEMDLGSCVKAPSTPSEKAELPAHGRMNVKVSARDLVPYLKRLALDSSPEMAIVREGMRLAVTEGTGRGADTEGMEVCGKTGSSADGGMFVAFTPKERPVVGLVIAIPGARGTDAAAVAGRVFQALGTLPPSR